MTLSNMVLSHASDDGAAVETKGKGSAGSKSLVGSLKSMLAKPKVANAA
jgi:pilus assembly protein CpaE